MREITIKVYTIDELSEGAKKRALDDFYNSDLYPRGAENMQSLDNFMKLMPVSSGWSIDRYQLLDYEKTNAMVWELRGKELQQQCKEHATISKWTDGGCDLTGFHMDCPLTNVFWNFMQLSEEYLDASPNFTLESLIDSAYHAWKDACIQDELDYFTMESFVETSNANNWEYFADGKFAAV